jgi:putative isomerase
MMIGVKNADSLRCLQTRNQAKPVLAHLTLPVADEQNEVEWFAPRFERLLRFYESRTLKNLSSIGLLVWADDVAIGDDNDPTTFGRRFFSANLLLNRLYFQDLRAAGELARRLKRSQEQRQLSDSANALKTRIQQYCWDRGTVA